MRGEYKLGNPGEGMWKFVRVKGEYRFVPIVGTHADVLGDGEAAESAGLIAVNPHDWRVYDRYSMSLKVCMDDATDTPALSQLLGLPYAERY